MVHATNFKNNVPGASLAAVVDANLELAEERAKDLGVDLFFSDLYQALDRAEIDAICITTPTFTHAEIAIAAARAGAHIFCEKPMALTLEEQGSNYKSASCAASTLPFALPRSRSRAARSETLCWSVLSPVGRGCRRGGLATCAPATAC